MKTCSLPPYPRIAGPTSTPTPRHACPCLDDALSFARRVCLCRTRAAWMRGEDVDRRHQLPQSASLSPFPSLSLSQLHKAHVSVDSGRDLCLPLNLSLVQTPPPDPPPPPFSLPLTRTLARPHPSMCAYTFESTVHKARDVEHDVERLERCKGRAAFRRGREIGIRS